MRAMCKFFKIQASANTNMNAMRKFFKTKTSANAIENHQGETSSRRHTYTIVSETGKDHILRLPIELLEHTAEYCDVATDILALRLSCRKLAAAAFRVFITEYIEQLVCFILDPDRLQRILNIVAQPHLAKKVQTLELCLFAQEIVKKVHLAPRPDREFESAEAIEAYAAEQYDKHECDLHGMSDHCWILLKEVMLKFGQLKHTALILELRGEESIYHRIPKKRPTLVSEILDLAQSANCRVTDLHMNDGFDIVPADFMPQGRFHSVLKDLESFGYHLRASLFVQTHMDGKCEDIHSPKIMRQVELTKAVYSHSNGLSLLGLSLGPGIQSTQDPFVGLSSMLLQGSVFHVLRRVYLEEIQVRLCDLSAFFGRCRGSLQILRMTRLDIPEHGDPWTEVFHVLRECPKLETIRLYQNKGHPFRRRTLRMKFVVPGHGPQERFWSMPAVDGGLKAKDFLDMNIRHGLVYENTYL